MGTGSSVIADFASVPVPSSSIVVVSVEESTTPKGRTSAL
jgi:hypothetical protein